MCDEAIEKRLTPGHIVELVRIMAYASFDSKTRLFGSNQPRRDLVDWGLIQIGRAIPNNFDIISFTEKGSQVLSNMNWSYVFIQLSEWGEKYLLSHCLSQLSLSDLPSLLASGNEWLRDVAKKGMRS